MAQTLIDQAGVKVLLEEVVKGVNTRIGDRIVDVVNEAGDAKHVPSAKAVYDAIAALGNKIKGYQLVTGAMDTVTEPDPTYIYLQRDDETDTTLQMYVRINDAWVGLGNTDLEISVMSNDAVKSMFNEVFTANDPLTAATEPSV